MHAIAPVPNHNGSPASDLADQMFTVAHALEEAADAIRKWQPHGRDYQIGGDYQADREEFLRRLRLIDELARQYETEGVAVSDYHYNKGRVG
jgi:hypothetical protein